MVKLQISFQFHPKIWGNDPTKNAFIVGTQQKSTPLSQQRLPIPPAVYLYTSTNPRVRSEQKESGILIASS